MHIARILNHKNDQTKQRLSSSRIFIFFTDVLIAGIIHKHINKWTDRRKRGSYTKTEKKQRKRKRGSIKLKTVIITMILIIESMVLFLFLLFVLFFIKSCGSRLFSNNWPPATHVV